MPATNSMNVCCFPLIHCSTIFHQMVPILFTFKKVVCERVCVFCECTQRLTFNLQWKSTEKMCACVCCRLWELISDQKLIMFFFLWGPMPGDTSLYFYYYTMDFFRFFKWHCVGEYYGLLLRSLKTNDITCWLSLNKFIGFQALQLFSLP